MNLRTILYLLVFVFNFAGHQTAYGELIFPSQISQPQNSEPRKTILRSLGYGTSTKLLGDPYPLGGYMGLGLGVTVEMVPTHSLNQLNNPRQDTLIFSRLTLSKGLFNQIDLGFHFIPFHPDGSVSGYGGSAKWTFYEGGLFPVHASVMAHASSSNFNNQLTSQSYGGNLVVGASFDAFAIYAGGGHVSSVGRFKGTALPNGVADESVADLHSYFGMVYKIEPLEIATQLDLFAEPMIGFRLGMRL